MNRRDFVKLSAAAVALPATNVVAGGQGNRCCDPASGCCSGPAVGAESPTAGSHVFNGAYAGAHLQRVAFPLGGIGAGMICLEGTGSLSQVSIRNRPDVFNEPCVFAALSVRGAKPVARVLEGPVPPWKLFGMRGSGWGDGGKSHGLPRFRDARFEARFPFGTVTLADPDMPVGVELTGWSPFTPGDADRSSLPLAALEYRFTNSTDAEVEAVFSFNAVNFLPAEATKPQAVRSITGGFVLWTGAAPASPWEEASFAATVSDPNVKVNHAWFRGGWFDPLTMAWNDVAAGACYDRPPTAADAPSPGATLFVPLKLAAKTTRTMVVRLCWYAGQSNLREAAQGDNTKSGCAPSDPAYRPWYAGQFADVTAVAQYWQEHYESLRADSQRFADAFYDTTLPPEVIEAVAANLGILKSPTVLRQSDGRFWAWEGSGDDSGCCSGSCTHVWNYAQAVPHLFPSLERSLRETEFGPDQDEHGHQQFRAALPIRPVGASFHAAADGQLGGIMKVHRDWRISGDTTWLRALWPKVRQSLDYCIATWDPARKGWLEEPHHNTYDIEFWGPDGMCTSIYLGALQAAVLMGRALGDNVDGYAELFANGRTRAEAELFDGEYFYQKITWRGLRAADPTMTGFGSKYSPEALALLEREGPKYQYGTGCLSDGVLGAWLAAVCGIGEVLDRQKVESHLRAVHRHNYKRDLSAHVNPQRPGYALGGEGGLLLCTWPKGGALSLPFVYSNEVWTGIEYQVASHLLLAGRTQEGLEIVRTCRARYDGRVRNPFDEYECGHWYARAMASYALLQALSGARYDAVDQVLYLAPTIVGDFRCFLATATGYGTVGVKNGKPFLDVANGKIPLKETRFTPAASA